MKYTFLPPAIPTVAINGSERRFPVHRIYCVGRNYRDHALEMGSDPEREPPFFFTKPADAIISISNLSASPTTVPYPSRTRLLHYEIELVVALGKAGSDISVQNSPDHIFGYAVGIDLTRRDLQQQAKDQGRPWDTSKGFDHSAPVSAIHPLQETGELLSGNIWLNVNGEQRQSGDIANMIWSVNEVIAELSTLYHLVPGDLIFTGTPAGIGAIKPGDELQAAIDGLDSLSIRVE